MESQCCPSLVVFHTFCVPSVEDPRVVAVEDDGVRPLRARSPMSMDDQPMGLSGQMFTARMSPVAWSRRVRSPPYEPA